MNMPRFTAEGSLYRSKTYNPLTALLAIDVDGQVSPAQIKGTHCTLTDPDCPSGFRQLICRDFNPDHCIEGRCCTPTHPPPQCCPPGCVQC
jgi:hypothetical protein